MVLDAAGTMMITERIDQNNLIGHIGQQGGAVTVPQSTISTPNMHWNVANPGSAKQFHNGSYNYMFVDGHVEYLEPLLTIGALRGGTLSVPNGIWTMRSAD